MSTYGQLLTDVLEIVPRPDKEDLIRTKLNEAIRLISVSGYFWRDIIESTVGASEGVSATANVQSITITTAVRKMIYVQYPDYTEEEDKITLMDLNSLQKRELCTKLGDIAYLAGSTLHIRNSKLSSTFNIAYYTNPDFFLIDGSEDGLSNWITELAPGLCVDVAASYVLNLIGDNEDSKRVSDLASILRSTYIKDFMDSIGV